MNKLLRGDYYPFGMGMVGRATVVGAAYRYGFNGQEISPEINVNSLSAEYWQYDSRIGRRWNVDPEAKAQPWESPYSTFNNGPIWKNDEPGKLPWLVIWALKKLGQAGVYIVTDIAIQAAIEHYIVGKEWGEIDIDWWAAIGSGTEAFVGSKKTKALMSAGWDMLTYTFDTDDWSLSGFIGAGIKGGLSEIIGDKVGDLVSKYGTKAVSGIGKMLGSKYEKLAIRHLWSQFSGIVRGSQLEDYWVEKFAKGWEHVGKLKNGFYKGIDTWKNGVGLSIKTTNAATEKGRQTVAEQLRKNIDDIAEIRRIGIHPDDGKRVNEVRLLVIIPDDPKYDRGWLEDIKRYAESKDVKYFETKL